MTTSSLWLLPLEVTYLSEYALDLKSPINQKDLLDFLESNHNLMIFGDVDSRKAVRNLFNEFGADLENVVKHTFFIHIGLYSLRLRIRIFSQSIT